jgi:hypothetical protein
MLYAHVAFSADRSLARSALPHAPTIPSLSDSRSPGPARRQIAGALRRSADRLAPATA